MKACGILKFSDDFTGFVDPQGVGCLGFWSIDCGESIVRAPEEPVSRPLGIAELSDNLARSKASHSSKIRTIFSSDQSVVVTFACIAGVFQTDPLPTNLSEGARYNR